MTARQREIWALYARGHGPTEIALALGLKSRGSVYTTIQTIKKKMQNPKPKAKSRDTVPCPYSNSCFTCPLPDCRIISSKAPIVNVI